MALSCCQVEAYLQEVLECQKKTLGNTLKRSLQRYPNQARVEWLMNADPPGSINKTDPAQVCDPDRPLSVWTDDAWLRIQQSCI